MELNSSFQVHSGRLKAAGTLDIPTQIRKVYKAERCTAAGNEVDKSSRADKYRKVEDRKRLGPTVHFFHQNSAMGSGWEKKKDLTIAACMITFIDWLKYRMPNACYNLNLNPKFPWPYISFVRNQAACLSALCHVWLYNYTRCVIHTYNQSEIWNNYDFTCLWMSLMLTKA